MSNLIAAYLHAYVPDHNAGAETTMHDMLKYWVSIGNRAVVVLKERSNSKKYSYEVDGVEVHQAVDKTGALHWLPKADLTMSHLECSPRTAFISTRWRVPHAQLIHNSFDLTKGYLASGVNLAIFNTEWMRDQHSQYKGQSIVLHPPVNPDEYKTTHGKKITMVNFHENKNPKVFWELARRNPGLEFLAVKGGYGVQELEDLPNVEIMENTSNPRDYLSKTKLILMPSFYESYGRVPVEGLASGIPAIVSPTPGLRTSLGDAATFVDPEDVDGWNSSIHHLLKPRVYGDASKRAYARSEFLWNRTQFELGVFADAALMTIDLYRKLK